jgi:hypothetical protein
LTGHRDPEVVVHHLQREKAVVAQVFLGEGLGDGELGLDRRSGASGNGTRALTQTACPAAGVPQAIDVSVDGPSGVKRQV